MTSGDSSSSPSVSRLDLAYTKTLAQVSGNDTGNSITDATLISRSEFARGARDMDAQPSTRGDNSAPHEVSLLGQEIVELRGQLTEIASLLNANILAQPVGVDHLDLPPEYI